MFQVPNMLFALPEMLMLGMACVILLVVAFTGSRRTAWVYGLSQLTLLATAVVVVWFIGEGGLPFADNYI